MARTAIDVFCDTCGVTFRGVPRRTFLGFHKLECPHCDAEVLFPLSNAYRFLYSLAAVGMGFVFFAALARGHFAAPGLISTAILVGLVKDYRLRKQLAATNEARRLRDGPGAG